MEKTYRDTGRSGRFPFRQTLIASALFASQLLLCLSAFGIVLPETVTELGSAGNWQGVLDALDRIETSGEQIDRSDRELADFLKAASLFHTDSPGAREALETFASRYPASPHFKSAILMIGDCCFFAHDYGEAMTWYSSVNPSEAPLPEQQRTLYAYRLAVSRLMNGLADDRTEELISLMSKDLDYRIAARYYQAYSDYLKRDYDKAFSGFEAVAGELSRTETPREGMEPQYYMVQILYRQAKFDEAIRHGTTILKKNRIPALLPELHRVIGLSYFKKGNHHSAHGLLDAYVEEAVMQGFSPSEDAVYALGVCEYEEGDRERAAAHFSTLTDLQDITGQGAWYHLGEIAMAEGRYDEAVMDFSKAAHIAYDPDTAERAAYNRIAAVTHGGNSPFQSTTAMYEEFLTSWPSSRYADNVRKGLYQAYAASRDYDNALLILDGINNPGPEVIAERQKILYAKGAQQERSGNHRGAATTLEEALKLGSDPDLNAEIALWLGQAQYGAGNYAASVRALDKAIDSRRLSKEKKAEALYQRAYSNLRREKYADAARDFRSVTVDSSAPRTLVPDSKLRLADCLYYTGNLKDAAETYDKARETDSEAADYATLRMALMAGLQGDRKRETALLRDFLRDYPQSGSRPEAMFRLGTSLEAQKDIQGAQSAFSTLTDQYPTSPFAREGALRSANLLMKSGSVAGAVTKYRDIISRWPASPEAKEADTVLRDHYAAEGNLEEYASFLASINDAPKIRPDQMEEITFRSAERAYVADLEDTGLLKTYLEKYPDGRYLAQALLWTAQADADAGRGREALEGVDRLIQLRGDSPEAEDARLLREELKDYVELFSAIDKADSPREAKKGLAMLTELASNPDNPVGAQANVELGERLLKAGRHSDALAVLDRFTESGTPHRYWLARGFLVLADVHHAMGKDWLAKEYVITLRDSYPGSEKDISEGITRRLKQYDSKSSSAENATSSKRKSRKRK